MKYLSFVRSSETYREMERPAALMQAIGQLMNKYKKQGALVTTGGLGPSRDSFKMRVEKGTLTLTDGPFTESKEVIGGWAVLAADTREGIIALTREFMEIHRTHWPEFDFECEVRPIEFEA